ncbi:MAG: EamA family transporter, partial [Candidatus Rokuibacteriota bacterium]
MPAPRLALPALVLGAASIGVAPILVRYARLEGVGPSTAAFYRLTLALPFLWAWTLAGRKPENRPSRRDALALLAVGGFFAADLAAWHWAILLTQVANAT